MTHSLFHSPIPHCVISLLIDLEYVLMPPAHQRDVHRARHMTPMSIQLYRYSHSKSILSLDIACRARLTSRIYITHTISLVFCMRYFSRIKVLRGMFVARNMQYSMSVQLYRCSHSKTIRSLNIACRTRRISRWASI